MLYPQIPSRDSDKTSISQPVTINNTQTIPTHYTYYQPPPYISTIYRYQTVNNDKELQRKVTNFFLEKTKEWIKKDKTFSKNYQSNIKNEEIGFKIIHNILKLFVRKGNTNWYDLKEQKQLVKDFIKYKLSK